MENNDLNEDQIAFAKNIEPIVTVMQQMLNKIEAMDEELDSLAKLVNEEIIGGITNLYNTKKRLGGISDLQTKYSSVMDPYKDFYSEMTDNKDIYEALYDELEELKNTSEELDDAAIDGKVNELASILKAKLEKVGGIAKPVVSVEIEKTETSEPSDFVEKLRRMKNKAGNVKFN